MPAANPDLGSHALSSEQVEQVREHLNILIESASFKGSKRAQIFLQFVVDHVLAGKGHELRERMIGARMFGRPIDYDTSNDAVVRVKASEVRKKLDQYYRELKDVPPLRIELPRGSYVPKFHWESQTSLDPPQTEDDPQTSIDPAIESVAPPEQYETEIPTQSSPGRTSVFRSKPLVLLGLVFALCLIAVAGYLGFDLLSQSMRERAAIRSIVVLPLQNLSGDPRQDYFADAITEELSTDLGQISAFRVISRTSAMTYKGTKKTLREIAAELNVEAIVEGSVHREGTEVRVVAQLIDTRSDQHLWARSYTRKITSILTLEGELAQAIANEVRINVTSQEQARLTRVRTVDPEAQDLYFQGLERLNAEEIAQAVSLLQRAVDKDPDYAQAHALLANSYDLLGETFEMSPAEAFPKAKAEALQAVKLDDTLAEAHAALGLATLDGDWDWVTGEKEYQRALELNPNSANAHVLYSLYLAHIGRFQEATAQSDQAVALDPMSSLTYDDSAYIYFYARRYDQALALTRHAMELPHNPSEISYPLGRIELETGHYAQAIHEFQQIGDSHPFALGLLGDAYARSGNATAARQAATKLEAGVQKDTLGRSEYEIARVYAGLGEKDKAVQWLEKAFDARDYRLIHLKDDPSLDPLRSNPRFQALVRRIGFPS